MKIIFFDIAKYAQCAEIFDLKRYFEGVALIKKQPNSSPYLRTRLIDS